MRAITRAIHIYLAPQMLHQDTRTVSSTSANAKQEIADYFVFIAAYASVLVRDAWRLSPSLLLTLRISNSTLVASTVDINNVGPRPAITDSSTNLTIIFDPDTYLPSRIRAYENHQIFGPSTSDILLYNYTKIEGVSFARNIKLLYNEDLLLQEMLYDSITVNPELSSDFFAGLPESAINQTLFGLPPTVPQQSELYNSAEVFESS